MKTFIVTLIVALTVASCSNEDDVRCYIIDYIEVEGEKLKVGEFKCGCFPTSGGDEDKTLIYEGIEYPVTQSFECY